MLVAPEELALPIPEASRDFPLNLVKASVGSISSFSTHSFPSSSWREKINSLTPGRCGCKLKCVICKLITMIDTSGTYFEIALRCSMPTDSKSTSDQVMAWCHQATRLEQANTWTNADQVPWCHVWFSRSQQLTIHMISILRKLLSSECNTVPIADKASLVKIMDWCFEGTSHYL